MITNLNPFNTMEQFFNTSWFIANIMTLYVGIQAKLLMIQSRFIFLDIAHIKYYATLLGIISTIIFLFYNLSKWKYQRLVNKKFKKDNNL